MSAKFNQEFQTRQRNRSTSSSQVRAAATATTTTTTARTTSSFSQTKPSTSSIEANRRNSNNSSLSSLKNFHSSSNSFSSFQSLSNSKIDTDDSTDSTSLIQSSLHNYRLSEKVVAEGEENNNLNSNNHDTERSEMQISRAAKRLAALTQLEGNEPSQSSSSSSATGNHDRNDWWENVLPPGQLAERLRRAQPNSSISQNQSIVEESDDGPRHSRKSILRSSAENQSPKTSQIPKRKQYSSNSLPRSGSNSLVEGFASSDHALPSSSMYLSPPSQQSSAGAHVRAGTWSSQSSSYGSYLTPSTRSSISVGEMSSSSSSNDESPSERRSPILGEDWSSMLHGFGDRGSGATSPTSITRSHTSRRRRYIGSDDGTGLGVTIRGAKGSVVDLDERLRQWNNALPFTSNADRVSSPPSNPSTNLRPFPSSRQPKSSSSSTLYDTPEHSSAEEDQYGPYHGNRRFPRTSSTRTSETVRDGVRTKTASLASAPSSRRSSITAGHQSNLQSYNPSRRVSFSKEIEVVQSNDVKKVQTIGRAHGRSISSLSEKQGMAHRPLYQTTIPNSTRPRTHASNLRAQEADVKSHAHSHLRGKRSTCYSAPTSPRVAAMHLANEAKDRSSSRLSRETTPTSSGRSTPRTRSRRNSHNEEEDADVARLAVLSSSLGAAHNQLSSARSLAIALTRQLSAPLRPFFHLTLLISISSVAFVALASFLFAGYLCTIWDDVNSRGKSLQNNVTSARKTLESRVQWTRTMLGIGASEEAIQPSTATGRNSGTKQFKESETGDSTRNVDRQASKALNTLSMPIRFFFTLPIAIAQSLIPAALNDVLTTKSTKQGNGNSHAKNTMPSSSSTSSLPSGSRRSQSSRRSSKNSFTNSDSNGFHTLPPRPPLSSLLPSIAFTIVIAFGAGLASFFANRASTPANPDTSATHPSVSASSKPSSLRSSVSSSPGSQASSNSATAAAAAASRRNGHHRFDSSSSNRANSSIPPSPHARHRSSGSNDFHVSHEHVASHPINQGRKSPFTWQEGVSAFS